MFNANIARCPAGYRKNYFPGTKIKTVWQNLGLKITLKLKTRMDDV